MLGSPGTGLAHLFCVSLLSFYFSDLILTTKSAWWDCYLIGTDKYPKLELWPPTQGWFLTMYWHSWTQLLNSKVCSECNNSDLWDIFFFYNYLSRRCDQLAYITLASQLCARPGYAWNCSVYNGSDSRHTDFPSVFVLTHLFLWCLWMRLSTQNAFSPLLTHFFFLWK